MKLMIGENIRAYRKKHDLTQEELAERLGVTYQSVSRWENGATYPDLELLECPECRAPSAHLAAFPAAQGRRRARHSQIAAGS